jgi:hypothetical protein
MTDTNRHRDKARDIWERYEDVAFSRGHEEWMAHVRRLEDYWLAGGRQWRAEDRAKIESEGRPVYEVDVIKPAINAIVGYQIANRIDLSFVPRGGQSDEQTAKLLSKVVRQVLDNANWRHCETDVFLDGLIQQRGYIDVRMGYERNDLGEPTLRVIDPMDGIPDPDARESDPDSWADWIETRWLTEAQIEGAYDRSVAKAVVAASTSYAEADNFGAERGIPRSGFDESPGSGYAYNRAYYGREGASRRYRIIHRQVNEYRNTLVARWPTGDIHSVEEHPREYIAWLLEQGIPVFKKRMRVCRMEVAAPDVLIHDEPSPYKHLTVVPFFPYFRRGRTAGAVDSLTSVQDMLNKFISQYGHVVNGSANSGWQGEAGQLKNMDDNEFVRRGAETGLVLLRKKGAEPFEKIQPNQIPNGLDKMIEFAYRNAQVVSGVDDAMLGLQNKDLSGVAVQSLQYAAQQKQAIVLDNLSRSRRLLAMRVLEMTQQFMGAERVMRIAETNAYGEKRHVATTLNQRMEDGSILNDLTVGTYDLVLNEQPAQVTFDNSQFEQMKTMRTDMGIQIPDARVLRASNLIDKSEIAEELEKLAGKPDPVADAEAALKQAQARHADAQASNKMIEAQFSAVKTAREIVLTPQVSELADALLRSGGYVDADAAPIVPAAPAQAALPPPSAENSHPLLPPNPTRGLVTGLDATTEDPIE